MRLLKATVRRASALASVGAEAQHRLDMSLSFVGPHATETQAEKDEFHARSVDDEQAGRYVQIRFVKSMPAGDQECLRGSWWKFPTVMAHRFIRMGYAVRDDDGPPDQPCRNRRLGGKLRTAARVHRCCEWSSKSSALTASPAN